VTAGRWPPVAKKDFRPEYEYLIYKILMQYRQKRPVRIATGCSGLETPILACIEMKIEVEHVLSSEVNQNARDFAERANVQAEHVFDNIGWESKGEGYCFRHNKSCIYKGTKKEDLFVVGPPCQGCSSLNNSYQDKDVVQMQQRDDHVVLEAIAIHMRNHRPRIVIVENVMGFLKKRGHDGQTVLHMVTELIAEKAPNYHVHVFKGDAAYWVPMPRSRAYLVFVAEEAGGQEVLDKIKAVMEQLEPPDIVDEGSWKQFLLEPTTVLDTRLVEKEARRFMSQVNEKTSHWLPVFQIRTSSV